MFGFTSLPVTVFYIRGSDPDGPNCRIHVQTQMILYAVKRAAAVTERQQKTNESAA